MGDPCAPSSGQDERDKAGRGGGQLDVGVFGLPQNGKDLNQLTDAAVEIPLRPKSGGENALVRDNIIPLVRILTDGGLDKDKFWKVLADLGAELELGKIGLLQTDIVRLALHRGEIRNGMDECAGDILDVNKVPFEVPFENENCTIMDGTIDKIVDEKIDPHSGRSPENGG